MDVDIDKLKKSDSFCIAPWIHMMIDTDGRTSPCCLSSGEQIEYGYPVYGSIHENTLEEIWNSDVIKKMRLDMLNGVKRPECAVCRLHEQVRLISYRNELNELFKDHFDFIFETKEDGTFERFNLVYWDFRLSNTCNFKCRMCWPGYSSRLGEEIRQQFLNTDVPEFLNIHTDHPSLTKIDKSSLWSEIDTLCPIVEKVHFAGGEPLIMDSHYTILDKLIEHKKFDTTLSYNTNFSTLTYKEKNVLDYWEKFPNLSVYVSMDGFEERGELIRKGLNWNKFVDNAKKFHERLENSKARLNIYCTAQLLNSIHVIDLHKKLYEDGIIKSLNDFYILPLHSPSCMSVHCLPFEFKKKIIENIKDYIEFYLKPHGATEAISQFVSYAKYLLIKSTTDQLKNFIDQIQYFDKIRNENTREIFPEFEEIIWKPYLDA